jgi:transposase-like protein
MEPWADRAGTRRSCRSGWCAWYRSTARATGPSGRAITSIARNLGVGTEALRPWLRRAQIDDGQRSGLNSRERERLKQLERVVRLMDDLDLEGVVRGKRERITTLPGGLASGRPIWSNATSTPQRPIQRG